MAAERSNRNPRRRTGVELSLAESVCLALIDAEPRHGWAIVKELEPGRELGEIWTLTRALTYRAIDQLETKGLIARGEPESGAGRSRVMLRSTAAGRRWTAAWITEPVTHVRDLRTEFLLKATLLRRSGGDVLAYLDSQEATLGAVLERLGNERGESSLVDTWRRESARAAQRFFHRMRADLSTRSGRSARAPTGTLLPMRLSARNQLTATLDAVHDGEVLSTVKAVLPDGQRITATITKEAARDLDLTAGDDILVIIRSTEVMIAK